MSGFTGTTDNRDIRIMNILAAAIAHDATRGVVLGRMCGSFLIKSVIAHQQYSFARGATISITPAKRNVTTISRKDWWAV